MEKVNICKRDKTKLNTNYISYLFRKPLYPMNYILLTGININNTERIVGFK